MSRILAFFCAFAICLTAPRAWAEPAMWVVTDDDSAVYLLGTIHFLPPDLHWQSDKFRKAFEASEELWIETELDDDAAMQQLVLKYGVAKEPLSRKLSILERRQLGTAARTVGLSPDFFQPLRPWFAAFTLVAAAAMQAGMSPDSGVDRQLQDAAKITGKNVRGLEEMEQQIRFLSDMPPELELDMLRQTLADFSKGEVYLKELLTAWHDGDLPALEATANGTMREEMPGLYEILIVNRNKDWTQQIDTLMAGAGTHFIAVGAGHMVGADSVPAMLAERGHSVTRY
jgi:uncharacterized protein YbaP (TraB family)